MTADNLLRNSIVADKILIAKLESEIDRLSLTETERKAARAAIYLCGAEAGLAKEKANADAWAAAASALRGFLERTGGNHG